MAEWTSKQRDIMGDAYRLLQRNFTPKRDGAYWDRLISEGRELYTKYDYDQLALDMVAAINLHLEKKLARIERGIE